MTPITDEWETTDDASMALVIQAEALTISDTPSYEAAVHLRSGVKALIEEIRDEYKPQKQAMDAAKRVILDKEKARLAQPEYALGVINERLGAYEQAKRNEKRQAEIAAAREAKETGAIVPAKAVEVPKVDGFGFSTHYKARLVDKMAALRAVVDGELTPDLFEVNQKVADDLARTSKGKLPLPGFEVVEERRARG